MNDFKPGDVVICINADKVFDYTGNHRLKKNEKYIIEMIRDKAVFLTGDSGSYHHSRFVKYSDMVDIKI